MDLKQNKVYKKQKASTFWSITFAIIIVIAKIIVIIGGCFILLWKIPEVALPIIAIFGICSTVIHRDT